MKPCEKYKDSIEQYSINETAYEQTKSLLEHIGTCDACRDYLESLMNQNTKIERWIESMDPFLESGQSQAVNALYKIPDGLGCKAPAFNRWHIIGYFAAACVLITTGFMAGRGFGSSMDVEVLRQQIAESIQPQIEDCVTASVLNTLETSIPEEYSKVKTALSDQIATGLEDYTKQVVMRNDIQTYRLLAELIDAIQTAQVQNREWALTAMGALEEQRLLEQEQVRSEMAAFVVYTDQELDRTRRELQNLATNKTN